MIDFLASTKDMDRDHCTAEAGFKTTVRTVRVQNHRLRDTRPCMGKGSVPRELALNAWYMLCLSGTCSACLCIYLSSSVCLLLLLLVFDRVLDLRPLRAASQ